MLLKNKLLVGFGSIIRSKYTFTKISELLEKPVGSSVSIKVNIDHYSPISVILVRLLILGMDKIT